MINYKAHFLDKLVDIFSENPDLSIGEVLHNILYTKNLGCHYFYASDETIYSSTELFHNNGIEKDEILTEEDFLKWINKY